MIRFQTIDKKIDECDDDLVKDRYMGIKSTAQVSTIVHHTLLSILRIVNRAVNFCNIVSQIILL